MNIYNYYICIYTTIFFLNICIETIYSCKTMMMITSAEERERKREGENRNNTQTAQEKLPR